MELPKKYIIIGNSDYKGWLWLYDADSLKDAQVFIDKYLKDVTWQWALTEVLQLHGYEELK
jgi:hypothetical protein